MVTWLSQWYLSGWVSVSLWSHFRSASMWLGLSKGDFKIVSDMSVNTCCRQGKKCASKINCSYTLPLRWKSNGIYCVFSHLCIPQLVYYLFFSPCRTLLIAYQEVYNVRSKLIACKHMNTLTNTSKIPEEFKEEPDTGEPKLIGRKISATQENVRSECSSPEEQCGEREATEGENSNTETDHSDGWQAFSTLSIYLLSVLY